jgi:hypothetical protein
MKILSVLFTVTLLVSTSQIAAILRRMHALPERSTMIRSISLPKDNIQ